MLWSFRVQRPSAWCQAPIRQVGNAFHVPLAAIDKVETLATVRRKGDHGEESLPPWALVLWRMLMLGSTLRNLGVAVTVGTFFAVLNVLVMPCHCVTTMFPQTSYVGLWLLAEASPCRAPSRRLATGPLTLPNGMRHAGESVARSGCRQRADWSSLIAAGRDPRHDPFRHWVERLSFFPPSPLLLPLSLCPIHTSSSLVFHGGGSRVVGVSRSRTDPPESPPTRPAENSGGSQSAVWRRGTRGVDRNEHFASESTTASHFL